MDISSAWKGTCKVLLGGEVGELDLFRDYLVRYVEPVHQKKSAISGKPVSISSSEFCSAARFISRDETEEYNQRLHQVKLDLNALKDIDSAVAALGEHLDYCGNSVTGNSQGVEASDSCSNCFFVSNSNELYDCKNMAYCSVLRFCENSFGSSGGGESKFMIKCFEVFQQTRCMETFRAYTSADCYYSANLEGCTQCLFSFNQRNKSRLIGNRPFSADEYNKLKAKLTEDIRSELAAKKSLPSIVDIIRD